MSQHQNSSDASRETTTTPGCLTTKAIRIGSFGQTDDAISGKVVGRIERVWVEPPQRSGFVAGDAFIANLEANPVYAEKIAKGRTRLAADIEGRGASKTMQMLRLARGLSQAELARRIDSNQNRMSLIENGKTDPQLSTLRALSRELGVSLDVLSQCIGNSKEAEL